MASTSSDPQQQPITLHFQNLVRVAGETIEGCVDLHVPLLRKDGIENLRIEMQGVIKTQILRTYGQVTVMHKQVVPLFPAQSQSLWTSESPHSDSDIVSFPFRFTLPEDLPPSFAFGSYSAVVRYSLEVVGERPGVFHRNRRVRRVLVVMPAASEDQVLARESLRQGWNGPWKAITQDEKVRQGIWGEYSRVHASVSLPDLPEFPISTPIPYNLHVVTETKTLDRSDRPEDKHGKPLFPVPPTQSSELTQVFRRKAKYTVRDVGLHEETRKDTFDLHTSQTLANTTASKKVRRAQTTPTQSVEPAGEVHTIIDEPEWVPKDDKGRGIWRRSVRFTSTLAFPFAPTCTTETLRWSYILLFTVPFPGIGNDLKLEVPVHLGPASACPPPPTGAPGSSNLAYADILPAGPPPMLDLPPTYWAGDDQDWDDEKDEKKKK
ncbi:hypothetical protein DFH08DRAFT_907930 [Mycena albidolilacea]|uniref:Arrestin-like N-terminal domain-containing protein n=1 Tax=Mycena albidolilacea TaxID=1033008 RepID=A0AAD6YWL8_9AGAR|nr:hypothetical protein DFH08DRAFT_907930 [Mycena albidolilacea]